MTPPTRQSERAPTRYGQEYRIPSRSEPARPSPRDPDPSRVWPVLAVMALVAVVAGAIFVLGVPGRGDDGDASTPIGTAAAPETGEEEIVDAPAADEPVVSAAAPVAPYVRATLTGKDLVLSGTVADAALVEQLGQASQLVYAPFVQSELVVDEQLPSPPWLAAAPPAVMLLQLITEGTLTLSDGVVTVEGTAASANDVARLQAGLAEATGLPVELGAIEVTNLREVVYVVAGADGQVALSGALPTEELRAAMVAAAAAIYGPENVLDASTVDAGVAPTLWMYNPQGLMATLGQFPDFEVRLSGGAFTASLGGGAIFPSDSIDISPEFAQVLNFGVVVLSRDPSMTIKIEGHTDSAGPDDYNLQLSQDRADAVAAYFVAAGINTERVTAIGVGEAEPASSNDTAEGRSRNRRVEFTMSSDA